MTPLNSNTNAFVVEQKEVKKYIHTNLALKSQLELAFKNHIKKNPFYKEMPTKKSLCSSQ
jgi:hypothetical protein